MTACGPFPFRTDDLAAPKGVDWGWVWKVTDKDGAPIDVTGWTATAQARQSVGGALRAEWTETDGITLSGDELTLRLDPAVSALWEWDRAVYEIQISSPTDGPFYFTGGTLSMRDSVIA